MLGRSQRLVVSRILGGVSHTGSRYVHPRPLPAVRLLESWPPAQNDCRSAGSTRRYSPSVQVLGERCAPGRGTHASSNSRASLRKAFLHFLQMKVMSNVCMSGWSLCSWWHSAQSNHFCLGRLSGHNTFDSNSR
ncbi:hypothetical protein GMOD_00004228 [Pyrenophora seminiperda CCB06]|uniref:Uncharacterized protein n=1 Tax=Pyrenophora seminiperda CCB06 TaxID=1302712 RepID=A0A3M7M0N1_9PLEO|nr:hypothetical protein GMOD_00004228 [Pyrenophora seminiperda CCB06]